MWRIIFIYLFICMIFRIIRIKYYDNNMEVYIIILLIIFVVMVFTLDPFHPNMILHPTTQTSKVQCYKDHEHDLVMLPNVSPASLIMR